MSSGRLYKLKHFCSLCQKQLKDDNGYKCHLKSDSHRKMMHTYMTNPEKLLNTFSNEFEAAFLDTLKTRHPKTAVMANTVYQELIKDQFHVHMNSTRWSSLNDFVKYLESEEICEVEWNESRPVIKFIDKNAKEVTRESEHDKKVRKRQREADREENHLKSLGAMAQKEIEMKKKREAKAENKGEEEKEGALGLPGQAQEGAKINFNLNLNLFKAQDSKPKVQPINVFKMDQTEDLGKDLVEKREAKKTKRGNLDMLLDMVNRDKKYQEGKPVESYKRPENTPVAKKETPKDAPWLCKGLIVKIMQKELGGGKFYKQKGKVYKVTEAEIINGQEFTYVANVKMISGPAEGTKIRIDQINVLPVVPIISAEGGKQKVMILKGKYKGTTAILNSIDASEQVGIIQLGEDDLLKLDYDCFSEFYSKKSS